MCLTWVRDRASMRRSVDAVCQESMSAKDAGIMPDTTIHDIAAACYSLARCQYAETPTADVIATMETLIRDYLYVNGVVVEPEAKT